MKVNPERVLLILAALALLAGGAWAAQRELAMFAMDSSSPPARLASLMEVEDLPPSIESRHEILRQCSSLLFSIYARMGTDGGGDALIEHCGRLARSASETDGANSLAWSLQARVAGLKGDYAAMNQALALSYTTGANEQWLAANRFATGERYWAELTPEVRANHEADIRLMLGSRRAIATLVSEYLAKPDFRARLIELVEGLPNEDQRRFINDVRRVSRNLGGMAR